MRVEIVLRRAGERDETRLHDRRLAIDQLVQIDQGWWRVSEEDAPTMVGASLRYVCVPAPAPP
jgi:hypothetical protein